MSGSVISPDAILGSITTATLVLGAGLWKLATMIAEVRGQVRHNGGSTLKDDARKGAQAAERAEVVADEARTQAASLRVVVDRLESRLSADRDRQITDAAHQDEVARKTAHDIANVRTMSHIAVSLIERINSDRIAKEAAWSAALRAQGLVTPDPAPMVPVPTTTGDSE